MGADEVAERLASQLSPLRVGLVHGRMRADERDAEMSRFRDGGLDVLVGTTVVEVGVDVPEATMMVILNADRFGLSQLHQLRGRVGRGDAQSYCVLAASVADDSVAWARLKAIHETNDGFVLAEQDWKLRGEGDVLGLTQSGLPRLRVASLAHAEHQELAVACRAAAEPMLDERGRFRAEHASLAREIENGWLAADRRRRCRQRGKRRCLTLGVSSPESQAACVLTRLGRGRVRSATRSNRPSSR